MHNVIIRDLDCSNNKEIDVVANWFLNWWTNKKTLTEIKSFLCHTSLKNDIFLTRVAVLDDKVIGVYQILMNDDLKERLNYYPWLANVYIDEAFRGNGFSKLLISDSIKVAKNLGYKDFYLHTKHIGLYEPYGFEPLEEVKVGDEIKRVYKLTL